MVQKNILNKSMLNEVPKEEPIKVKHSKSSIMSEVRKYYGIQHYMGRLEDSLRETTQRLELVEKKLLSKLLTRESREIFEREVELLREVLDKNRNLLQKLRRENTRTFMVAAPLVFACFLLYGLYCLIFNPTAFLTSKVGDVNP
ncbi:GSCOCG00007016001-RA-CDS [Cotesia congregata]|uniref:uncharacterized protein LOC123266975 isoform X1 n=1 Tax=Cotesia glomerata TaxID=32391 RepID=UPI001750991A|nr:uncharacterized protein LOC123266975 isoform X1 [Cotesia glomerata]CAD6232856.1 GSCOCG00007016001-RA-CDS [Cotesia congregata]